MENNWLGSRTGSAKKKKMEPDTLRRNDDSIAKQALQCK